MKPHTPGFWFIAVLLGLLALSPAHAGMTPGEVKAFNDNKAKAENGSASSQSLLGYYYNNGLGVAKNNVQAVYWFRKAAAQGDTYAEYILGMRYAIGDGVAKDVIEAYAYLSLAGETNKVRSLETKMTPDQIATGQKRALELKKEIAANIAAKKEGKFPSSVSAGMTPEEVKAFKDEMKKAEKGDRVAQYNLGNCYYNGEGVTKDQVQAAAWWRKAADQGYADAQSRLGLSYELGYGVAKDQVQAVSWYRKAAEQGHAKAQSYLGICYQFGLGVAKDEIEAYAFYDLAKITEDMTKKLYVLELTLSPAQIAAGQKRSIELQKKIAAKIAAKKPVK